MQTNNKGFVWLPVLLVILSVLAVSGGVYWYVHQKTVLQPQDTKIDCAAMHLPPDCNPGVKEVPNLQIQQSQTQAATAPQDVSVPGMSKYTDADIGFSIWYPNGWVVSKEPVNDNGITRIVFEDPNNTRSMNGSISWWVKSSDDLTSDQLFQERTNDPCAADLVQETIDGEPAVSYTVVCGEGTPNSTYVIHQGYVYSFLGISPQMTATFKFPH